MTNKRELFISKARLKHGEKYDYSLVEEFSSQKEEVTIICPKHGKFKQSPRNHLSNGGCYLCRNETIGKSKRKTKEDFVQQALEVHGDKYDYSDVVYTRNNVKVAIKCPSHGTFMQTPDKHLQGRGCPTCAKQRVVNSHTQSKEQVLERFKAVHGNKYDYSKFNWVNGNTKITIICPNHGEFHQTPVAHYSGQGCPACAKEVVGKSRLSNLNDFVKAADSVHQSRYDYRTVNYINSKTHVDIWCRTHGLFRQIPNDHLDGHGCPTCARITRGRSKSSNELMSWLATLTPNLEQEKRINPDSKRRWRADGYIPDLKLFIEYNGLRWHSTKFTPDKYMHLKRQQLAAELGCRVVTIHEDEWYYRKEAVKNLLRHLLGKSSKIYARKCEIREVSGLEAKEFYERNHIQGCYIAPKVNYGLYSNDCLVACMSFDTKTSNRKAPYQDGLWELVRFASTESVVGGAGKIFKHFIKEFKPKTVLSFSLNHLFTGRMYECLGFKLDKVLPPDYHYVDTKRMVRLHKSNFQHSRLKHKFENYDSNLTEEENCANNNFYRIYDCGKKRWIWNNEYKD